MKRKLNQKLIYLIEYYNLINANLLVSNAPLQRSDNITSLSGSKKIEKLEKLKQNIQSIKNCNLKKSATNIVFGDGNTNA